MQKKLDVFVRVKQAIDDMNTQLTAEKQDEIKHKDRCVVGFNTNQVQTLFTNDTMKGGVKRPELAKYLCENSGANVDWLKDKFSLDRSLVTGLATAKMSCDDGSCTTAMTCTIWRFR